MKVILYYMNGCPHCVTFKTDVLPKLDFNLTSQIEKKNIPQETKVKYGIKQYPTLVFLKDNGAILDSFTGIPKPEELNRLYELYRKRGE